MEANTPYALYDNDGSRPMQWAAHIRLTPELLRKLQQAPEQVLLTLNANLGGGARKSSKKTSLLSVDMGTSARDDGETEESGGGLARYELHSFQEDPRVNYLCTFRQGQAQAKPLADTGSQVADTAEDGKATSNSTGGGGYSMYTTGKIYQKLIVQRMLDSTEKGRMKDRHAQSVIESRSRASKLLEDQPAVGLGSKRKRVSLFSSQVASKSDAKTADAPIRKIKVATHTTRSVVLDEEDYDAFVQQHEAFRADWETLDKAYSIEMISIEGLPIRLEFAASDHERAELERERQENARKKEALLFVRETMASIQKILSGIQTSIVRYDKKQV